MRPIIRKECKAELLSKCRTCKSIGVKFVWTLISCLNWQQQTSHIKRKEKTKVSKI